MLPVNVLCVVVPSSFPILNARFCSAPTEFDQVYCRRLSPSEAICRPVEQKVLQSAPNIIEKFGGDGRLGGVTFGVTGLKLLTIIEGIDSTGEDTVIPDTETVIEGTENDVSGGNIGVIVPTAGLPGVTGVTRGIDGFVTPRDIGCLLGSLTCMAIPRSISFGCCNDWYGLPASPPVNPPVDI